MASVLPLLCHLTRGTLLKTIRNRHLVVETKLLRITTLTIYVKVEIVDAVSSANENRNELKWIQIFRNIDSRMLK